MITVVIIIFLVVNMLVFSLLFDIVFLISLLNVSTPVYSFKNGIKGIVPCIFVFNVALKTLEPVFFCFK